MAAKITCELIENRAALRKLVESGTRRVTLDDNGCVCGTSSSNGVAISRTYGPSEAGSSCEANTFRWSGTLSASSFDGLAATMAVILADFCPFEGSKYQVS